MKPLVSLSLVALALTAFTGCSKDVHEGVDMKGRIGFGVVAPQSGDYRQLGIEYFRGMKVAESTLNAGGGAEGKKVRVLFKDSAGEREKGLDGVRALSRDFGAPFIAVAQPRVVDRVADEIAAGDSVCFRMEGGPQPGGVKESRFLRAFVSGRDEAALMAATVLKEKGSKVLVLACEDRYGDDAAARLAEALAAGGATSERLPLRRDNSVADIGAAVAGTKYDAVCVFGHGPEIPPALLALKKGGYDFSRVLGNHAFGGKSVTLLDLPFLRGLRFTTPDFGTRKATPAGERFRAEYRSLNGDEPDMIAALGYDQVMIAFTAAKSAESLSAKTVREKILEEKTFEGAAGVYEFDETGVARLPLSVGSVTVAAGKSSSIAISAPFPQ